MLNLLRDEIPKKKYLSKVNACRALRCLSIAISEKKLTGVHVTCIVDFPVPKDHFFSHFFLGSAPLIWRYSSRQIQEFILLV